MNYIQQWFRKNRREAVGVLPDQADLLPDTHIAREAGLRFNALYRCPRCGVSWRCFIVERHTAQTCPNCARRNLEE